MKSTVVMACCALTIWGLSAQAQPAANGNAVDYRCTDGVKFVMVFSGAADNFATARLTIAGRKPQTLRAQRAASGAHYANARYAYDEWHGEIRLTDRKTKRSAQCSAE